MSNERSGRALDLGGLIGETGGAVSERLGPPSIDRSTGEDRWLVFEGAGWSVRMRLAPDRGGETARVRAWTATFERGFASFEEACEAVSVAPDPPRPPDRTAEPALYRRSLSHSRTGELHSLTADGRAGRIRSLTAFDEPPDWRADEVSRR